MTSPISTQCPLYLSDLYEGASFLCNRLGIERLLIVSPQGQPVATFQSTASGGRIDPPSPRPTDPAANVPLILFAQVHMRREARKARNRATGARRMR